MTEGRSSSKEITQEVVQRTFEVGEADVGINNQTFHLMGNSRSMRLVAVITVYTARRNNTDAVAALSYRPDLDARRLGPQQTGRVKPEGIMIVARAGMTRKFNASKLW